MAEKLFTDARIDLSPEHLAALKDVKVGGRVRVVLYGTVKLHSERQIENDMEGASSGTLELNVSNMKLVSNNDIADLFDEEFDA